MRHPQGASPTRRRRLSLGLVIALIAVDRRDERCRSRVGRHCEAERHDQGRADHEGRDKPVLRQDEGGSDRPRRSSSALSCIYAAGKNSSDNAGQITAIENMVTARASRAS